MNHMIDLFLCGSVIFVEISFLILVLVVIQMIGYRWFHVNFYRRIRKKWMQNSYKSSKIKTKKKRGKQLEKKIDYQLIGKREVFHGKRLTVEQLDYFNTRENKKIYREHVLPGDAVVILPFLTEDKIIMIEEPRTAIGRTVIGLPAGQLEKQEKIEEAAIRELEEETGYRAHKMTFMRKFYPSCGYSSECIYLYRAEKLEKTQRHLDETEDIKVKIVPLIEAKKQLETNEIVTASTTIALLEYFLTKN